jgi:hypothetical protein
LDPKLRLRVGNGNVNDLEVGRRFRSRGGDGLGALRKLEMGTYMFQYERRLGSGRDPGSIDEYWRAGVKSGGEKKVRDLQIFVE